MSQLEAENFNLASVDFWMRPDWHIALERLRSESPIAWHEHEDSGAGFWSLTTYRDVELATRSYGVFSNTKSVRISHDDHEAAARPASGSLLELDPPEHGFYRRLVAREFTPKAVDVRVPAIRQMARTIADRLCDMGSFDFVRHVSAQLPLHMISDLLGVPQEDRPAIHDLANAALGEDGEDREQSQARGTAASEELKSYGTALARERLKRPGEDLLTTLVKAQVDSQQLSLNEVGNFFAFLFAAGSETTKNAISHALIALHQFPDERQRFHSMARGLDFRASDELMRWATPVRGMRRTVMEDIDFQGIPMKTGDKVMLWYVGANRDPSAFTDGDRFDLRRPIAKHTSFGAGGPHFCLGAGLAAREILILFDELLTRFDDIEILGRPAIARSTQFHAITEMATTVSRPRC